MPAFIKMVSEDRFLSPGLFCCSQVAGALGLRPVANLDLRASLWTELKDRQLSEKIVLQNDITDVHFRNT